ncbi:hypothetical protein [Dactylosporangium sp. NPDC000521]|uniref:hypothetical protein n=1 Tax=Dactylosporangium sp. NPDC000521 TaxID=3363975 RepID=UPI0036D0A860
MRSVLLVAAVALALGGCASPSSEMGAPPSESAAASSAPASPSSAASVSGPAAITVSGQVVDGVEAGCVLLKTPDKTYLLLGGDRAALQAGKQVTVTGRPTSDLMTTCQQGTPFQVSSVQGG